jgi:hypothetical protein
MWTISMALSSQFEGVRDAMYKETRQMLEDRELGEDIMAIHLEDLQALILLTFYEFLRSSFSRAWLSAGKVFRLVQLLRLHEVDSHHTNLIDVFTSSTEDQVTAEEKRRAFWTAYCLDRFISPHNRFPLTLSEESVSASILAPKDWAHGRQSSLVR